MRRLSLLPALLVAVLLVLLLLGTRASRGGGGGPRGDQDVESARRRANSAAPADDPAAATGDKRAGGSAADGPTPVTFDGRLVYLDGAPAVGVLLHLAVGRPLEVSVFRNGERTTKTVYLVVGHTVTTTGADGVYKFADVPGVSRARSFVFTVDDPQAFVVAEVFRSGETIRARRCVRVTGRLVDREGKPLDDYWFEGRAGTPEDWQTRVLFEEDSFVAAGGDLGVDSLAKDDTRTETDGSFSLILAEGRNTLVFGEVRSEGTVAIDVAVAGPDLAGATAATAPVRRRPEEAAARVELGLVERPSSGAMDVGELRVPGATMLAEEHDLRGQVLTLAGTAHAGCDVLAWDGSIGLPTHAVTTDDGGAFSIGGLKSPNVILWAVPTDRRHVDLPVQTSATIRMPCAAPVVLTAPSEEEYAWTRIEAPGYYLFVRKGVFAAGEALDATDVVGLPPGPLHIYLVTDTIQEATLDLREPGEFLLAASRFRDTTWD